MFDDLMKRLLGNAPAPEPETDYRFALSALLVRCARTDGVYDPAEIAVIDQVLQTRYGITEAEAQALRAEGEVLEASAGDTVSLTRVIKTGVPFEERVHVVEALWRIVLADESREAEENAYLRLVVSLIGVSDVDSAQARQRAMNS